MCRLLSLGGVGTVAAMPRCAGCCFVVLAWIVRDPWTYVPKCVLYVCALLFAAFHAFTHPFSPRFLPSHLPHLVFLLPYGRSGRCMPSGSVVLEKKHLQPPRFRRQLTARSCHDDRSRSKTRAIRFMRGGRGRSPQEDPFICTPTKTPHKRNAKASIPSPPQQEPQPASLFLPAQRKTDKLSSTHPPTHPPIHPARTQRWQGLMSSRTLREGPPPPPPLPPRPAATRPRTWSLSSWGAVA